MGDKKYWDEKFAQRGDKPLEPEASLVSNIKYFKAGSVADIACGDGRNSLFLLANNFEVTGIDFSTRALERLERFAKGLDRPIATQQIDLSIPGALKHIGTFDNIVVNHYRLKSEHFIELEKHISEKGILFVSGFGHKHKTEQRIKEEDLIRPADFEALKASFELVEYSESDDERGFLVTYIYRKKY